MPTGVRSIAARAGLLVMLAGLSLPVLAATSLGLKCDSSDAAPAITPVETIPIQPALDKEPLTALKTDADSGELDSVSDFRILNGEMNETAGRRQAELRSAALADALERRQRQRLDLPPETPAESPKVETRLPGVSDTDSLLYRREMYRKDI